MKFEEMATLIIKLERDHLARYENPILSNWVSAEWKKLEKEMFRLYNETDINSHLKATQAGQQKKVSILLEEVAQLKGELRLSRDKEAYYVGKIKDMQEMIKILYR